MQHNSKKTKIVSMKNIRKIITIVLLLSSICAVAESHMYQGKEASYFNILYSWDGEHIYSGNSEYYGDILYTFDGQHVYQGARADYFKIIFTWDGKHLYKGNSTDYFKIILLKLNCRGNNLIYGTYDII